MGRLYIYGMYPKAEVYGVDSHASKKYPLIRLVLKTIAVPDTSHMPASVASFRKPHALLGRALPLCFTYRVG